MNIINSNDKNKLAGFIERFENLEDDKKDLNFEIKEVYAEAKAAGFQTKILKKVIALRKIDTQQRLEEETVLESYLLALGMIYDHSKENEPEETQNYEVSHFNRHAAA